MLFATRDWPWRLGGKFLAEVIEKVKDNANQALLKKWADKGCKKGFGNGDCQKEFQPWMQELLMKFDRGDKVNWRSQ